MLYYKKYGKRKWIELLKERERERRTELRLAFKEGLSLEIIRLSLTKSSEAEEQEDRILKSLSDAVWPVSVR